MTPQTEEYRTIPLTLGQVAIVDADDYEALAKFKWSAKRQSANPSKCYAIRYVPGEKKSMLMARQILGLSLDDPRSAGHVSSNCLDNRKCNLKIITDPSQRTGAFAKKQLRPIEIPIGPSIAYVPLTQGFYSLIDRQDAELVGQWNWNAMRRGKRGGAIYVARSERVRPGKQRPVQLHAMLLGLQGADITADHINRNPLDNRRSNLRPATRSEQCFNRRKQPNKSSQYVGVTKLKGRWRASIRLGLGIFDTEEQAGFAYQRALKTIQEMRRHGKFPLDRR